MTSTIMSDSETFAALWRKQSQTILSDAAFSTAQAALSNEVVGNVPRVEERKLVQCASGPTKYGPTRDDRASFSPFHPAWSVGPRTCSRRRGSWGLC